MCTLTHPEGTLAADSPRGLHLVSTGDEAYNVVLAPDGTPWFTGDREAAHVTADGRVTRYALPAKSDPGWVTWGADDALWAMDLEINGFTRMTPDGRFAQYPNRWRETAEIGPPSSILVGPDGAIWYSDRAHHQIRSVALGGSTRLIANVGGRAEPELLAVGGDGSVWFGQVFGTGLRRLLPSGQIEALRYRSSQVPDAAVAPNGDVWFVVSTLDADEFVKRTAVVRIDPQGHVTTFPAPPLEVGSVALSPNGTVWIAGNDLARTDAHGKFQRIRRAEGWQNTEVAAAPDGRIWLIFSEDAYRAAWLPPEPCLSRRRVVVHLHGQLQDPVRSVTISVAGSPTRTVRGRNPTIPIDLRGYLPGTVKVKLAVRSAHRRYIRHRAYRTCAFSG